MVENKVAGACEWREESEGREHFYLDFSSSLDANIDKVGAATVTRNSFVQLKLSAKPGAEWPSAELSSQTSQGIWLLHHILPSQK